MRELTIQAEVGRRLRVAIAKRKGLSNKFHWNAGDGVIIEGGKNDDIPEIIENLIASGKFTSADKVGLQALSPDTLRSLAGKVAVSEEADTDTDAEETDDDLRMNSSDDGDYEDFIHCHRPKAMRRELPETRARRNQRAGLLAPTRRRT